jgi:hypothetical protein
MELRDLIRQIVLSWEQYQKKAKVDSSDPAYRLVVEHFPDALKPHVARFSNVRIQGSTGAGNITASPWIALFDARITASATTGYYIVYLFATDLSTVTLCLAFGTTQFAQQFGATAFSRMRAAATRLQEAFEHLIPPVLHRGPIDLKAKSKHKLHYSYQQSAILSYEPYRVSDLPDERHLVQDLQDLVKIYSEIASDPIEMTVDRLVEAVADKASQIEDVEIRDFVPRPAPKSSWKTSVGNSRRYSAESRKSGDAGEEAVVHFERRRLRAIGRADLADRVRWHGPEREYCGWDITSFDDEGNEIFIEVKSSVGKHVLCINLTVNEWNAASTPNLRGRYYLYIVTNCLSSKPSIERMRDPIGFVENNQVGCTPIVYELRLTPPESQTASPNGTH